MDELEDDTLLVADVSVVPGAVLEPELSGLVDDGGGPYEPLEVDGTLLEESGGGAEVVPGGGP